MIGWHVPCHDKLRVVAVKRLAPETDLGAKIDSYPRHVNMPLVP
jgi:hypothetical protein